MTNIVKQHWTSEELTEVLIAWNVLRNPWSTEEQRETAEEKIHEIKEVVADRLNIIIK